MADFDVFICHASDDKDAFVRPLAHALRRLGVLVWYDEFSIDIGDSVSRKIDQGIAGSQFGIVVLSKAFLNRRWPEHELRGLVSREIDEDLRILPIWLGITKADVTNFSPSLSDKLAINTQNVDAQDAAIRILRLVRRDLYESHPHAELEKLASGDAIVELQDEIDRLREQISEYQCPHCGAELTSRIDAPVDDEQKHWDVVESFACGYQIFGGSVQYPCPQDPAFPTLDEYTLLVEHVGDGSNKQWRCEAWPKTEMARKVRIDPGLAASEDGARRRVQASYLYRAGKMSNADWFNIHASPTGEPRSR